MPHARGLTSIELLIVIAVLVLVTTAIYGPLRTFRDAEVVNSAVEQTISLLNEAKSASVSSKELSQYGVHFEAYRAVLFKGASFAEPSSYNKELRFDAALTASTSLSGGASDIVFAIYNGEPSAWGSVTVSTKDGSKQSIISISRTGVISRN